MPKSENPEVRISVPLQPELLVELRVQAAQRFTTASRWASQIIEEGLTEDKDCTIRAFVTAEEKAALVSLLQSRDTTIQDFVSASIRKVLQRAKSESIPVEDCPKLDAADRAAIREKAKARDVPVNEALLAALSGGEVDLDLLEDVMVSKP